RCGFIWAVGDDAHGQALVASLASAGVDTSHIAVKRDLPSGQVLALVDRHGRRALYVLPGANSHLSPGDIDLDYVNQAAYLHLSAFVGDGQLRRQRQVVEALPAGVRVSFAPGALYATRKWEQVAPLVSRSHILFINRDEIQQLTGQALPEAARRCIEAGCRVVVVTSGGGSGEVCTIYEKGREVRVASQVTPTEVQDSTGAGDAFAAGFLYGLLQGSGLEECARFGEIMAVLSLRELGARAGLPTREELLRVRQSLSL
ncbi:MAG: PfkB family carbohydrate kinase, partial [Chloroflexota bacterium]